VRFAVAAAAAADPATAAPLPLLLVANSVAGARPGGGAAGLDVWARDPATGQYVQQAVEPVQVVDPNTGLVTVVAQPTGTATMQYPGGPAPAQYPTQAGQTYPGYTPPPPPPPEESLEPVKKKKKKTSMTIPIIAGLGAVGIGAVFFVKYRRG
jgi:hypothetical protein